MLALWALLAPRVTLSTWCTFEPCRTERLQDLQHILGQKVIIWFLQALLKDILLQMLAEYHKVLDVTSGGSSLPLALQHLLHREPLQSRPVGCLLPSP